MVEMSSFSLPPAIRRLGRCTGGPEEVVQDVHHHHGSQGSAAGGSSSYEYGPAVGTERVKSFMNGIVSPFTACWQPTVTSCVSGGVGAAACVPGCGPDYSSAFQKKPAVVVSPLSSDRGAHQKQHLPPPYIRDSRSSPPIDEDSSSVVHQDRGYSSGSKISSPRMGAEDEPQHDTATTTSETPRDIEKPHSNDVLCGRGGSSNRHLGNIHFRELVAANKKTYVGLTKKQKMLVARKIVDAVRSTNPPGRFLAKDLDTGLFYDIGLPRSLEKTS
jgi:hypothetical protein